MRFVLQIGAARDSIAIQKALNLGVNLTGQCCNSQ